MCSNAIHTDEVPCHEDLIHPIKLERSKDSIGRVVLGFDYLRICKTDKSVLSMLTKGRITE